MRLTTEQSKWIDDQCILHGRTGPKTNMNRIAAAAGVSPEFIKKLRQQHYLPSRLRNNVEQTKVMAVVRVLRHHNRNRRARAA